MDVPSRRVPLFISQLADRENYWKLFAKLVTINSFEYRKLFSCRNFASKKEEEEVKDDVEKKEWGKEEQK